MGKFCPCCVDHSGGELSHGNGGRTHNSRSIVRDGIDDESEGSSGDVITEFGVGMQPVAMAPSIRKKSSLASTDDGAQGARNQDARVRFAVDDDELGGLQEYADFDSEAAAEALEGAAYGNSAVMERELTTVSHDESSVHSTASYVAME
jgi:hypothetical protein